MKKIGIYVHVPFCKSKCKYCDFISFPNMKEDFIKEYFNSVIYEIENAEDKIKFLSKECKKIDVELNNYSVDTIYFGGGTPSYVNEQYIENILKKIKEKFNIESDAEITIEINPGTITEEKIKKYKEIGINRVSIGLQSTNDRILNLIGRIHTYDEFLETYNLCKKVGFENINVDLMLALPTQTKEELEDSLIKIINLKPSHISLYSLIIEENTEIEKLINSGKLEQIKEDIEREMYWKTKRILEKNSYFQYEISNFSKKNKESRHNMNCWNQEEYLGFGIAAHSYFNNVRFSNITNKDKYLENIKNNEIEKNIEIQEKQNKDSKMKEFMMIGFRKIEGISISEFERRFEINPLFYFRFEIEDLVNKELIEVDLDKIKLTKKGLDFANIVFESFI